MAPVLQTGYRRGFESLTLDQFSRYSSVEERSADNGEVAASVAATGTKFANVAKREGKRFPPSHARVRSSPFAPCTLIGVRVTMLRYLLATLLVVTPAFAQTTPHYVTLTWAASPDGGTVNVYRAPHVCPPPPPATFSVIASGVAGGGPYQDGPPMVAGDYCYEVTDVLAGLESVPSNQAHVSVPATGCSTSSTFDPTLPGQLFLCDPVPPGPTCILSVAGSSTLCRINGTVNISENALPFHPLYVAPVDVFKFVAPSNVPVSSKTSYYLGSLVALGHNPDMVYLVPNACTLSKIVYDTRASGALQTPITISMWDVTQNLQISNSAVTQTWKGVEVQTVATPAFAVAANDELQVRFTMPPGVPTGYYMNMTVTAYCTDN